MTIQPRGFDTSPVASLAPPASPRAMPVQVLEDERGRPFRRLLAWLVPGWRRASTG